MTTTVITGANRGIGLEICRLARARGDNVIALCRNASGELEELDVRIESGIDVAEDASMTDIARRLQGESIDLLINNAGLLRRQSLDNHHLDAMRAQYEVNALGPLRVTAACLPMLAKDAKVALITSRMGSITDNTSGSHYGYRISKAALNIAGVSLAHDLRDRGTALILLHPGHVRTDMTGHSGNVEPADAAADLLRRIDELTLDSSGSFQHANGEILPW